ncbi:MAG: hypothetical protein ACRERU_00555 [Methylococcales bacterium]
MGFLLAVRDCCRVEGAHPELPDFLVSELDSRVGLADTAEAEAA